MRHFTKADVKRLQEIKDEVKALMEEAHQIVRMTPEYERAKAYWYGHIVSAIDDDHMFVGGCSPSFDDTIVALKEELKSEDEEEDDED